MQHATAVRHLRLVADALSEEARLSVELAEAERPFVLAAYAYGRLLEPSSHLSVTEIAFVVDRRSDELSWGLEPPELAALLARHRLDRYPLRVHCRPADRPVSNHRIRQPERFWSLEDRDQALPEYAADSEAAGETVLDALVHAPPRCRRRSPTSCSTSPGATPTCSGASVSCAASPPWPPRPAPRHGDGVARRRLRAATRRGAPERRNRRVAALAEGSIRERPAGW